MRPRTFLALLPMLAFAATAPAADVPLRGWTPAKSSPIHALADATIPLPFIGLAPCRIVDTRGFGAPIQGGPFAASESRTYTLTGQCGIPSGADAVSLNITVTDTAGPGFILIYPAGGTAPQVSTLNYVAGQTIANAAIVPLNGSGQVTVVAGVSGTSLIIDTNGYFSDTPAVGTNGFHIFANTGNYAGYFSNAATSCSGTCGVLVSAVSTTSGAIALTGSESGTTAYNYGVMGQAYGVGGTFNAGTPTTLISGYSAGVLGRSMASTGNVAGVWGGTTSSGTVAAGVVGTATNSSADAAFFQNAGAGVYAHVATGSMGFTTNGSINGAAITGTSLSISGLPKNFVAPDPVDPSKEIVYAAIEGPSADVFFRGTAHLVNGAALIQVPDHFRLTAREDSYMTTVTAVGARATLWVESEGPDGIVVRGAGDASFHYVVYAERDETRDQQPVRDNVHFTPEALVGKAGILSSLPERTRALLVKNGILNGDFTINTQTAERYGWKVPVTDEVPAAR